MEQRAQVAQVILAAWLTGGGSRVATRETVSEWKAAAQKFNEQLDKVVTDVQKDYKVTFGDKSWAKFQYLGSQYGLANYRFITRDGERYEDVVEADSLEMAIKMSLIGEMDSFRSTWDSKSVSEAKFTAKDSRFAGRKIRR